MATRSIIPVFVPDPCKIDATLAVMAFVSYIGQLLAGPYSAFVNTESWHTEFLFIPVPCAIVAFAIVAICKSNRKVLTEAGEPINGETANLEDAVTAASSASE